MNDILFINTPPDMYQCIRPLSGREQCEFSWK